MRSDTIIKHKVEKEKNLEIDRFKLNLLTEEDTEQKKTLETRQSKRLSIL